MGTASPRLDVLLVDEARASAEATALGIGQRHEVRVAPSVSAAVTELVRRAPQVLVCGRSMPPRTLIELLEIATTFFPSTRRILYSGRPASEWEGLVEGGLFDAVVGESAGEGALLAAVAPAR